MGDDIKPRAPGAHDDSKPRKRDEKPLDTPYPPPVVAGEPEVPGLPIAGGPPKPKPTPKDPPAPTPKDPPTPPPVADPKDKPLTIKYQGSDHELTYLALPEHRRATDTTDAVMGFGRSTTTNKRDVLSQMTVGDQILLLAGNNIHLSAKTTTKHKEPIGSMSGYRMLAKELKASDESVVRFRELKIMPENSNRIDNFSYTYREYASNLYKKFAFEGNLGAGVPDIFEFSTSASHKTGVVETGENIELHFQASQTIPKVRVVFKRADISLDEKFVKKIEDVCNKDDILGLLNLLERNGQFVPLSITLGGRIIITESKKVASRSAFDTEKDELQAAAKGKYVYDGVTIKGDAAAGIGQHDEREIKLTDQQKNMNMVTIGGDERAATSLTDKLGTHWIDTVAPFLGWKIIGFEPRALVPIIEFLDKEYADKCKAMLRKHFVAHLATQRGKTAGSRGDQTFQRDIKFVNRLKSLVVNHDGNIDGMKLNYEVYEGTNQGGATMVSEAGKAPLQDKVGKDRGKRYDTDVPDYAPEGFNPGEMIITIRAKVDTKLGRDHGILRQVQFITNEGRVYPGVDAFFGKNDGDTIVEFTANRVRGLHGSVGGTGEFVHSIGFLYLKLADNVIGRDYLLAMEPYLFPNQNYGIISRRAPE
jgi:MAC/Perforin domain